MKWNRWKRLKQKKGATLAELCVVMALVAIIGTSIVSFSALVQRRTNTSVQNGAVLEDLTNVEMSLKQWISHFDNANYTFEITDGGQSVTAKSNIDGTAASKISLNADKTMLISDGMVSLQVTMLKGLRFEKIVSGRTGRSMIRCTAQYHTAGSDDVKNAWLMFTTHAQGATLTR